MNQRLLLCIPNLAGLLFKATHPANPPSLMKQRIAILLLTLWIPAASFGQEESPFFFDEYYLSVNRTSLYDANTENRLGFGVGAHHVFRPEKRWQIVLGFEFNQTNQLKKRVYAGRFENWTNVTYSYNCLSTPFGLRVYPLAGKKIFLEAGAFGDLVLRATQSGIAERYMPTGLGDIQRSTRKVQGSADLANTVGCFGGIGVRVPAGRTHLIVKADYKFAFNPLYLYADRIQNRSVRISVGMLLQHNEAR